MRELSDSIEIDAPPDRLWDWLTHLADNYTSWHPDHISAEWTSGVPNAVGSVLTVVERLGGTTETLRFELTSIDPPRGFDYRLRGHASVLLPKGSFAIEPKERGSRFTAAIAYRFGRPTEVLFRRRMLALRTHMREEGRNLKLLIEPAGSSEDTPP